MKESIFFDESDGKPEYKVINQCFRNIKTEGFYNAILTNVDFQALEEDEQNLVLGVIMGDYGLSMREFIDECVAERTQQL